VEGGRWIERENLPANGAVKRLGDFLSTNH